MSKYRKVDPSVWNDAKFMALTDDGKLLFLLLLTHPNMTAVGAMRGSAASLSDDLGWDDAKRATKALAELTRRGMVEADAKAKFVALPNFLRFNTPENPNVLKAWIGSLSVLPECDLKIKTIQRLETLSLTLSEGFRKAFLKVIGNGMPNQEQEQEQEPLGPYQEEATRGLEIIHGGRR